MTPGTGPTGASSTVSTASTVSTVSGVGSMPGDTDAEMRETVRRVLDEVPVPFLPELPGRGAGAGLVGRTLAVVPELGFDLQPAGWRLTAGAGFAGVDHRRARSLLAQDLDVLEEHAQEYAGPLKVQLAGPWTLAATVERPRGDKLLADVGARRELAQALAEGVRWHLADVRRRVPGAQIVLQLDEPALPAVLAGRVPTASGFHRHRSVDPPRASELLEEVLGAAKAAPADSVRPAETLVHCCAAPVPIGLLRGAGADGVSLDATALPAASYDELGALLDDGGRAWLGVVPGPEPAGRPEPDLRGTVGLVGRLLDMLGLDPEELGDRLVLTPTCGLAGAEPGYAWRALGLVGRAAERLGLSW